MPAELETWLSLVNGSLKGPGGFFGVRPDVGVTVRDAVVRAVDEDALASEVSAAELVHRELRPLPDAP